jgi:PPM family protein phosphatase
MSPEPGTAALRLRVGAGTDRGLRRELNEDAFIAADPLFAVADGMGGHEAGEVASNECVAVLGQQPVLVGGARTATAVDVQRTLRLADARIRELANARAGTTLSGAVVVEEHGTPYWLIFNVGDSRTYLISGGTFGQVTVDHSEVQELVDGGYITPAEALVHPRRHVVTRALGTGPDTEADYWLVPVEDGDRLLVCSDGLTGEVSDDHIHQALDTIDDPQAAVDSLIQAALSSGGHDNITVIVVDAAHLTPETTSPADSAPNTTDDSEPAPAARERPLLEENNG